AEARHVAHQLLQQHLADEAGGAGDQHALDGECGIDGQQFLHQAPLVWKTARRTPLRWPIALKARTAWPKGPARTTSEMPMTPLRVLACGLALLLGGTAHAARLLDDAELSQVHAA